MKKALFLALPILAMSGEYQLEFYKDIVFLHHNLKNKKSLVSIQIPEYVEENDIDVIADCDIRNINIGQLKPIVNDKFTKHKEIKQKLSELKAKQKALQAQNNFVQNLQKSDENFIDKIYDITLEISKKSYEIEQQKEKLLQEQAENIVTYAKNLDVNFTCAPKNVKISYPVNFNIELKNDINADMSAKKVIINRNLSIKNDFITDLKDLSINIYPTHYLSSIAPAKFDVMYEDENMARVYKTREMAYSNDMATEPMMIKTAQKYDIQMIKTDFLNAWSINGVDIKINENKLFLYDTQKLEAKFDLFIDGYDSSNNFIRAKITPKNDVNGYAGFSIDGTKVSKSSYVNLQSDNESELFFGKNMLINVKKDVVKKYSDTSLFGTTKKTNKAWEYSIKNNSDAEWSVRLVERLPISSSSSVKVSISSQTSNGYTLDDKSGKVEFKLNLKPKESKKIIFGYEVSKPN